MSAETQNGPGLYPCALCPLHFSYQADLSWHYHEAHPTG